MMMMTMIVGVSRFPEQPAAAVSDAGREVSLCELGARARSSPARRAGQTDAEGSWGGPAAREVQTSLRTEIESYKAFIECQLG